MHWTPKMTLILGMLFLFTACAQVPSSIRVSNATAIAKLAPTAATISPLPAIVVAATALNTTPSPLPPTTVSIEQLTLQPTFVSSATPVTAQPAVTPTYIAPTITQTPIHLPAVIPPSY